MKKGQLVRVISEDRIGRIECESMSGGCAKVRGPVAPEGGLVWSGSGRATILCCVAV